MQRAFDKQLFIFIMLTIALAAIFTVPVTASDISIKVATVTATPPPTQIVHTVLAGEALSLIAEQYGVTVEQIVDANGLQDRHLIRIGQELIIPSADVATPSPVAADDEPTPAESLLACPQNTAVYELNLPAEPIRLTISGGQIYLITDGDLYRLPVPGPRTAKRLTPVNLMPSGRQVEDYFIRELVYVTADLENGDLLLLDKTNDVYRYTTDGQWRMQSPASQIPGQFPDPQFLAIQAADDAVYALDADLQQIWLLGDGPPRSHLSRSGLGDAVDMAVSPSDSGPLFSVLTRNGTVAQHQAGVPSRILNPFSSSDNGWPSQILAHDDYLYAVDGETRTVHRLDTGDAQSMQVVEFRLPGMRRLRSIAVAGETLYALAGPNLYVVEMDSRESVTCAPVAFDNAYTFYDVDLLTALADVQLPVADVTLRMRPRSYPGARRLYRQGIHRGLDIYGLEAPGLTIGSPVRAIADGVAVHVGSDYVEFTPDEYEAAISRTEAEHRTPPDLMEQFQGRQVRIDHGDGIQSWYSHLASTAPGLAVGDSVAQGDIIGTVGVSGTSSGAYNSSGGAHLHYEIWIGDHYLGHGLSLNETMRIWQAIFSPDSSRLDNAPTSLSTPSPTVTPTPDGAGPTSKR